VADCICLMGLQKHEAVPVDTHIFQLTKELYSAHCPLPGRERKSGVGKKEHEIIGIARLMKAFVNSAIAILSFRHFLPAKVRPLCWMGPIRPIYLTTA